MNLFGQQFTKEQIKKRIGDISQIGGIKICEFRDGNEKGVDAVNFRTGTGFNFTALPGRGMDISLAEFCGMPLCWRSSTGDVASAYYEPESYGWLRNFYGGLLVTCGLFHAGHPGQHQKQELGLHGRFSNIPAKNVIADGYWEDDDYVLFVQGKIRETTVFGENILLTRKIHTKIGEKKLWLIDIVENEGFETTPHLIQYHINAGFPVVSENSVLLMPTKEITCWKKEVEKEIRNHHLFTAPIPNFKEQVFFHKMGCDKNGVVVVAIINKKLPLALSFLDVIGFYIKYKKETLPSFVHWKMLGESLYVIGLEPANSVVINRGKENQKGDPVYLKPSEKVVYEIEIGVISSQEESNFIEKEIRKCKVK